MKPKWTPFKAIVWVLFMLALGLAELHHLYYVPRHSYPWLFFLVVLVTVVIGHRVNRGFLPWLKEWTAERAARRRALHG